VAAAGGALLPSLATATNNPFAVLRANWFACVTGLPLDPKVPAIKAFVTRLGKDARDIAGTLNLSEQPAGGDSAKVRMNFNRLRKLAAAYVLPGTGMTGDAASLAKISDGLALLLDKVYTTKLPQRGYDNWWDWQIGIPNAILDICILLHRWLPSSLVRTACIRIDHFTPMSTIGAATGANLLWWCKILMLGGALREDSRKIEQGLQAVTRAFTESHTGDGLYADGSFIQHTASVAYVNGYGWAFFDSISLLSRLLAGSPWGLPRGIDTIHKGISRGLIPAVWGGLALDSMRGRGIASRESSDASSGLSIANTLLRFTEGAPDSQFAMQWRAIAKYWLERNPMPLSDMESIDLIARCERAKRDPRIPPALEGNGFKLYYNNDRAIHRGPGWSFGIAACSARIARYESVNLENLRGWHTGDGMTTLNVATDRNQFSDAFWSTVDPYRLPGTTADTISKENAAGANTRPVTTWAGGAYGAGEIGAFGQDLQAHGSDLRARKSWFCLSDGVVALGAGITGNTKASIETVVENRNLHNDAGRTLTIDGRVQPANLNWAADFTGARWAHLDGVAGYILIGRNNPTLRASRTKRTGSWSDINKHDGAANADTRPYVSLVLNHGSRPSGGSYGYLILPIATSTQTADRSADPGVEVIANSAVAQGIIAKADGAVMVNFFAAGTAGPVSVSGPASVILKRGREGLLLSVADPTRSQATVHVTIDREFGFLDAAKEHSTIHVLPADAAGTHLLVEVGGSKGNSRTIELTQRHAETVPRRALFLAPKEGTYVRDGSHGGTVFSNDPTLAVKKSGDGKGNTGYSRRSLLKFDTRQIRGPVKRAVLWLNGHTADSGGIQTQVQAFRVASNWAESGVTWKSAPAMAGGLGTGWVTRSPDWAGLDVTAAWSSGSGEVSFAIWQPESIPGLLVRFSGKDSVLQVIT
jgi:hyaluronate lyase